MKNPNPKWHGMKCAGVTEGGQKGGQRDHTVSFCSIALFYVYALYFFTFLLYLPFILIMSSRVESSGLVDVFFFASTIFKPPVALILSCLFWMSLTRPVAHPGRNSPRSNASWQTADSEVEGALFGPSHMYTQTQKNTKYVP